MKKIMVVVAVLACLALPLTAQAVSFGFYKITNNGNVDVSNQLSVEVTNPGLGQASFTFYNAVGITSSITDIYFDDGTLLGIASINVSGIEVGFEDPAIPENLPGGNSISPPFETTRGFSADSDSPIMEQGVNAASEWVTITFNLINDKTYGDTIAALDNGDLRIGLHVQAIGTTGGSDSYVNKVPEPTTLLLLGLGLIGIAGVGRKLNK
jgi:hypothetical protein